MGGSPINSIVKICHLCNGTVQNGTATGQFCSRSGGLIDGRCCLRGKENTSNVVYVIGLDLSNCSLSHVENLQEASTAAMIDLSMNLLLTLDDSLFEGFIQLGSLILPSNLVCPGGNASWEKVEVKGETVLCEGQKDICNQTGHLSLTCPENSLCSADGPGLFQCDCVEDFHGYKCLREGQFPIIQVFGPLGASAFLVSILLWVTQRRKAKLV
uniref:EGF-like domain-containing protein n=1 Tax=Esox lucius TaxID=8010 RepID=A0A6Q2WYR6_ESOLU